MKTVQSELTKTALILGCGYVGSALAKKLVADGWQVGALTRNAANAAALRLEGLVDVIEADLDSAEWHSKTSIKYANIVNCVSSAGGGIAGYEKSYIEGQRSILAWAEDRQIKRYIYTSSTSVYPQDGGALVDEDASTADAPATGQRLIESENLLRRSGAAFNRWYVFRLAGIYGPGRQYLMKQALDETGVIAGRGDYTMNMIHRDDVVGILTRALDETCSAESGVYNVADNGPIHKEAALRWIAAKLGKAGPVFDPSIISPRLHRRGGKMPDRVISNARVKSAFDWQPMYPSFRDGLELE